MQISPTEYERFRAILEKQSGILLGANKQYLVVSRLSSFLQDNSLSSMAQLLDRIDRPTGSVLLKEVIDKMTTNETLWFRDRYPFEYLKKHIIPERRKIGNNLRIWCAACSTGQEPYSVAMQLEEIGALQSTEMVATDLSERVLRKAREGIYQQIELNRGMPDEKLKRYFSPVHDSQWQLTTKLRTKVRYQPLNLLNSPYRGMGKFDVIFCRNVLIYFSNENKVKVIDALVENLKPGGYLFLGASEALTRNASDMSMVRCNPGLVYQKAS